MGIGPPGLDIGLNEMGPMCGKETSSAQPEAIIVLVTTFQAALNKSLQSEFSRHRRSLLSWHCRDSAYSLGWYLE